MKSVNLAETGQKIDRAKLGMGCNPPFAWDENDISKYSLEQIAFEFMSWDSSSDFLGPYTDEEREAYIHAALDQSFPEENRPHMLDRFVEAYEKVGGFFVEASNPENIRELVEQMKRLKSVQVMLRQDIEKMRYFGNA